MKNYFLWLCKFVTVIAVVFVVIPAFLLSFVIVGSKAMNSSEVIPNAENQIAVVEVNGAIMEARETVDKLYKFANDNRFKGIILKVNSPGGAVAPSQEIYNTVMKLREKKPIYAVMETAAASGGYYISSACSKIYAQKGTLTASIGVISQIMNVKSLMEWLGIKMQTIKSGKLKDMGSMYKDASPEEIEYWKNMSDNIHNTFIEDVANARKMDINKLREVADGRVMTGLDAKNAGLVDEIGGVHEASVDMFRGLKINLGKGKEPTLYYPDDKLKEFKKILKSSANVLGFVNQGKVSFMYMY